MACYSVLMDSYWSHFFPVTTRSTSLTSIPHSSFSLRFSDLREIEVACREDEDQRAVRMLDWIGDRVNKHCTKWVHDFESSPEKENFRTPWWDDLRRCAEGEHVPSKTEGWNHPVAGMFMCGTVSDMVKTFSQLFWLFPPPHRILCKPLPHCTPGPWMFLYGWTQHYSGTHL